MMIFEYTYMSQLFECIFFNGVDTILSRSYFSDIIYPTMPKSRQESRNVSVGLKAQYSRRGGEGKEDEVEAVAR